MIFLRFVSSYPLIRLTVARQRKEADFRFALARVRVHAEEVALYGGEPTEADRLRGRFYAVVTNWHKLMGYRARVEAFVNFHNDFSASFALWLGWQPYFAGRITYGEVFVVGAAFLRVSNGLNWFMQWFSQGNRVTDGNLYDWAAAVRRLDAFDVELGRPDASGIAVQAVDGDGHALLETRGLALARPDGAPLTEVGDQAFRAGERWLLQGDSGTGKSTMVRAMAGLWPYGRGPAEAGIQNLCGRASIDGPTRLDSRLRGNDGFGTSGQMKRLTRFSIRS